MSARNMQYFPRYIDVAHRVARHCATCCATLQLQLWNMFYCIQRLPKLPDNKFQLETGTIPRDKSMSRIVSRDTAWHVARRCSYNFETCPIVLSECQNLLIINFCSKHAAFSEINRCRASCHATLRDMTRDVAATTLKHVLLYSAYVKISW